MELNKILTKFNNTMVVFFLLTVTLVNAQIPYEPEQLKNVPIIVQEAFQKDFPGKEPVWYKRYRGDYDQQLRFEGKFIFNKRNTLSVYSQTGERMALVIEVKSKEMPVGIMEYMKKNYPKNPIKSAVLVTDINDSKTYELGFYIDSNFVIGVFSDKGDFMQLSRG